MEDVEERMRQMFAAGERLWPQLPMAPLTQRESSLGYLWVERCVRRLLPLVETPNRQQLLADLDTLDEMRARRASQEEFWRWSEDIWYRPGRDDAQTAMSKLVWAAGCETGERPEHWRLTATTPVALLVECSPNPGDALEVCPAEYRHLRDNPTK